MLFERVGCAQCHKLADIGGVLGPNLAELEPKKRTTEYILQAVITPSRDVDAKYAVQKYALTHAKAMVERDRRLEDLEAENARLRAALRETLATIETKNLGDCMCCDGQMCGCQGSTNGNWLEYIIRAALGESHG